MRERSDDGLLLVHAQTNNCMGLEQGSTLPENQTCNPSVMRKAANN